ncbi:MAG: glycerol kinase [Planctomycetes bacterium RBG_16_64_10]|nr:MAG: glycerol kinase [Planctomycetes bacterium RBG_16_64_10]
MPKYILALYQGTTSSRAILFGHDGRAVAMAQQEFGQILPAPGLVEQDPEAIWASQLKVAREALARASLSAADLAAVGIANQRETTILWDRTTGRPVANAVVWQSRVSAGICDRLKAEGCEPIISQKTGLVLDAYFSGTKITHLLNTIDGLRQRAAAGQILFGTVDSWLIWRLTGGRVHVTDVSNASRTMLFNIDTLAWDDQLLDILQVPRAMLPAVRSSSEVYGHTDPAWLGTSVPIASAAGDQQAATFGQACFEPGGVKNTYGTGCFMLLCTGDRRVRSSGRMLSTVGWQLRDEVTYCLEGSVFVGGAAVRWLRDGLGVIKQSAEIERLAASVPDAGGILFVPAFVGLGAPHWDPYARGAIFGITQGTTAGHLARAAVESMAYQSHDLLCAMQVAAGVNVPVLKVDGGASVNDALLQFQADLLGIPVQRPVVAETTALGAAYLAGLAVGYWQDQADLRRHWMLERQFMPQLAPARRAELTERWQEAVRRSLSWADRGTGPR